MLTPKQLHLLLHGCEWKELGKLQATLVQGAAQQVTHSLCDLKQVTCLLTSLPSSALSTFQCWDSEQGGVEKPLPTHNHRACLKFSLHFLFLALLFLTSSSSFSITLCALDSVSPLCPPKQCQNYLSPVVVLLYFSSCWGWKMKKDPSRKWFPIPEVETLQVLEGVVLLDF